MGMLINFFFLCFGKEYFLTVIKAVIPGEKIADGYG